MFGLLYNFYQFCRKKAERKLTLVLLGIDNAGKTTISHTLTGELEKEASPTFGFNSINLAHGKYTIQLFDLGGGKNIRSVWRKYLAEVHGVIFVVDSADPQRFEEARGALEDTLGSEFLSEKPLLVLANKQDLPTAATAAEVAKSLALDAVTHNRYNILPCTAKPLPGQQADTRLAEGLKWLVGAIDAAYGKLNPRVQQEADAVRQEEARKKKEREERMKKAREERMRQREEEERMQNHQQQSQEQAQGQQEQQLNENVLSNGQKPTAAAPVGPLPHYIESPGKLQAVQQHSARDFSDLNKPAPDQAAKVEGLLRPPLHPTPPAALSPLTAAASVSAGVTRQDSHQHAHTSSQSQPAEPASEFIQQQQQQQQLHTSSGSLRRATGSQLAGAEHQQQQTSDGGAGGVSGKPSFTLPHGNRVVPLESSDTAALATPATSS